MAREGPHSAYASELYDNPVDLSRNDAPNLIPEIAIDIDSNMGLAAVGPGDTNATDTRKPPEAFSNHLLRTFRVSDRSHRLSHPFRVHRVESRREITSID